MKRRQWQRRLRQSLFATQLWAIHEPALASLFGLCETDAVLSRASVNAAIGLGESTPSTIQMVGEFAVIPIYGILTQRPSWLTRALGWTCYSQLETDVRTAAANPAVKAIFLYCDSPGGIAIGCEEAANVVYAARASKPITTFVHGQCASAAYMIGSSATRIAATVSSQSGSIGTVMAHFEYAEQLRQIGVGVTILKFGARKADGNPYEKLTPESRAALQREVTAYGERFENAVARHRGVSAADVRSRFGQGEMFLSAEAQTRGLIDQVTTWDALLGASRQSNSGSPVSGHAASANPAGVSAGQSLLTPPAAAAAVKEPNAMKISARVRAALFARNLITAQDADESVCVVALTAYFAARGEACPQDDDKICAGLFAANPAAAVPAANAPPANPPVTAPAAGSTGAAANVEAAHQREMDEARQAGATAERERTAQIRASGKLLNLPEADVQAAITEGKPHADVVAGWHAKLNKQEKPLGQNTVNVGQEGIDRFGVDACLALQHRLGRVGRADAQALTPEIRRLSGAPLKYMAEQCLAATGVRLGPEVPAEEVMEMAFAMDGPGRVTVGASYGAANRPGSFPNLLANLANKVLDAVMELSQPQYERWTGVWPGDLLDFKPATVVAKSMLDEMDEVMDAEASKEFTLTEQLLSYMVLRRFSNMFRLTPVMAANDDLGAFDEGLLGLEMGWQNTVNRLCLRLLTGNVALLDGFNLFDNTNHGNDVTAGGGAPSVAQWDTMVQRVYAQRNINGRGYLRTPLEIALVPPAHAVAARQIFLPLAQLAETKQPATDATINVYRGTADVVVEADLQESSNVVWYGLTKPMGMTNAAIIRAYFRGWGRNGRRQRWYDPDTKCWNFELEGRVGAAAKNYRYIVRNDGDA